MEMWTRILVILISRLASASLEFLDCAPCKCSGHKGNVTADCTDLNLMEIPSSVPYVTTVLLFAGNNLSLQEDTFENLTYLKTLDLRRNTLTYTRTRFPTFMFQNLTNLTILKINDNNADSSNNDPKYPTDALEKLQSLEWLSIDGLKYQTFPTGFSKLKRLKRLSVTSSINTCNIYSVSVITFKYLNPFLDHIDVVNCNLRVVEPGTFAHQKRLKTLDISKNFYLRFDGVTNATHLISGSLEKLIINEVVPPHTLCVAIKDQFCRNLNHTKLVELHAKNNKVSVFNAAALTYLPKTLKRVYMNGNRFQYGIYVGSIASLTGLEEVYLGGPFSWKMPFPHIPEMVQTSPYNDCNNCENEHSAYTPDEHSSSSLAMTRPYPVKINLPPNLKIVSFSSSQLYYHIQNISVNDNNNITEIDVSRNLLTEWNGNISGLEKVEKLNISGNIAHNVGVGFFPSFKKLVNLDISHNQLGSALLKREIFSGLSKLQTLNLSNNFITKLLPKVFSDLSSLIELKLSSNSIQQVQFDIAHMKNLKVLECSKNQIQWLEHSFRAILDEISNDHIITVDLSQNPIACTCDNIHFLSWMKTSRINGRISFGNLQKYVCVYDDSHRVNLENLEEVVRELEMSCYSYSGFFIGSALVVFVCLGFLACSLLYRFRWKLRYVYYAARHRHSTSESSSHEFVFDAFVSSAEEDREFVVSELLVKLEEESDMRLNFHQRDFTVGRPIAHNIIDAVKNSKRTLVILSRDFLKSSWCIHELQMAHMEGVSTGRDVLLIILMEHIPTNKIPVEVLYHMKSDSYIEYPLEGEKDVFWRRLIASLKE
ncbi:toll-like receptor 4 [Haliotis asinina]|uniref:toll-like receptor 4 n=1 Tax=Haliotis asinina TaxID=109174 RepID=UPI00353212D4